MSYRFLSLVAVTGLTLVAAAAHAQNNSSTSNCGVETWSTDKQTYVTVPCAGGQGVSGQAAQSPGSAANCGIETWSTDKQTYVTTPCNGGTTYENPNASSSENPNNK
jgi:hypothetical protein